MDRESIIKQHPVLVTTIVDRGMGEKVASMFAAEGVTFQLLSYATGTATTKLLDYLGLGETEKDLLLSTMPRKKSEVLLERLERDFSLSKTGHGIAFSLPIGSICGSGAARCPDGTHPEEQKENHMEPNGIYDLIIAVANRGFTDEIMEAARSASASGGTAIHARRVGVKEGESFFGVTVQPEKEVILILALREKRQGIMRAIAEQWGLSSKAKAVVFSVPVNDAAGLPV